MTPTTKSHPKLFEIPTRCHKCHEKIESVDDGFKNWDNVWYHKDCFGRNRG